MNDQTDTSEARAIMPFTDILLQKMEYIFKNITYDMMRRQIDIKFVKFFIKE